MQSANELLALRKYRDTILADCRESTAFASLAADAFVGLCACGAAVWVVCAMVGGVA